MEMCFHSNQHPSSIKHLLISLYFKYQSLKFIYFPIMNSPVFPSLNDIYCTQTKRKASSLTHGLPMDLKGPQSPPNHQIDLFI